ncbi:hypothetical protein ACVBEJ_09200 [Porticoccus sp. GXU_MW_L64]
MKRALLISLILLLTGCGQKDAGDTLCDNYAAHYAEYRERIPLLTVDYQSNGQLTARLEIPAAPETAQAVLEQADNLFALNGENDQNRCRLTGQSVKNRGNRLTGEYRFQCPADSQLKGFKTLLLDKVNELDELEARINTPAASKRFVIHRQCSKPLFQLGTP